MRYRGSAQGTRTYAGNRRRGRRVVLSFFYPIKEESTCSFVRPHVDTPIRAPHVYRETITRARTWYTPDRGQFPTATIRTFGARYARITWIPIPFVFDPCPSIRGPSPKRRPFFACTLRVHDDNDACEWLFPSPFLLPVSWETLGKSMEEIEAWWINEESSGLEYIKSREELIRAFFCKSGWYFWSWNSVGQVYFLDFFLMFDYKCVRGGDIFFSLASVFLRDPTRTRALW